MARKRRPTQRRPSAYWNRLTPEERSTEMKRRAAKREKQKKERWVNKILGDKPGPPRRAQMNLDRAYEVCRVFGLREFPRDMPFATNVGLDLPERPLTGHEIRVIGAATAGPLYENTCWHIGDLLLYLQRNPDAPFSYDAVVSRCQRVGLKPQTLRNYKSVARSWRFADRHPGVPWRMHSFARTLPRQQRDRLLARAATEHLSPEDVRLAVKAAHGATRSEIIAAQIAQEVKRLNSRRPGSEAVDAAHRGIALLNEFLEEIAVGKAH